MSIIIRSAQTIKTGITLRSAPYSLKLLLEAANYTGGSVWFDTSGFGNNAQLPVYITYVAAMGESYWAFDGTSSYAYFPLPVANDMSWGIWFNTTTALGDHTGSWFSQPMLIGGELPGDTFDMGIAMAQGYIIFGMGQPDTTMVSNNTYNDGVWHYLLITRNTVTGVANIYVDGTLDKTQSSFPTGTRINTSLGIAVNIADNQDYWQGNIGQIQAYSVVLPLSQIQYLFNSQRSAYGV